MAGWNFFVRRRRKLLPVPSFAPHSRSVSKLDRSADAAAHRLTGQGVITFSTERDKTGMPPRESQQSPTRFASFGEKERDQLVEVFRFDYVREVIGHER